MVQTHILSRKYGVRYHQWLSIASDRVLVWDLKGSLSSCFLNNPKLFAVIARDLGQHAGSWKQKSLLELRGLAFTKACFGRPLGWCPGATTPPQKLSSLPHSSLPTALPHFPPQFPAVSDLLTQGNGMRFLKNLSGHILAVLKNGSRIMRLVPSPPHQSARLWPSLRQLPSLQFMDCLLCPWGWLGASHGQRTTPPFYLH